MRADDFPSLPEVEDQFRVEIPFDGFRRMVSKILFAVSAEESRFQLGGALLKVKPQSLELVATDGHRLALVEAPLGSETEEDSVLVPRKALQELQRFEGDGSLGYRRGEHHLLFRLGRRELICRILEGSFPDYERVIARDNDKQAVFDRKLLDAAVQRVAILTGERSRAVRLELSENQLVVSVRNADLGQATEEIVCEYAGAPLEIGINPDYLRDFLAAVGIERVRLELKDENTQCVCYPAEEEAPGNRYLCVIMPMRV
jgi:DNA polymerase-3 subunit beta